MRQQARAGVIPTQAEIVAKEEVGQLLLCIFTLQFTEEFKNDKVMLVILKRDMAIIALAFFTAKRGDDLANLLITNIVRMPGDASMIFNFTFGKTLSDGSLHCYGIKRMSSRFCVISLIDDYVLAAKDAGFEMNKGFLFFDIQRGTRIKGKSF